MSLDPRHYYFLNVLLRRETDSRTHRSLESRGRRPAARSCLFFCFIPLVIKSDAQASESESGGACVHLLDR